jgi:hypothetical protein
MILLKFHTLILQMLMIKTGEILVKFLCQGGKV